jgi:hypothetical protein
LGLPSHAEGAFFAAVSRRRIVGHAWSDLVSVPVVDHDGAISTPDLNVDSGVDIK